MSYISYAQNFEDVMLMRVFEHSAPGLYVDVGAWHPEIDSVTKTFYDRGWHGVNIEPNSNYFQLLQQQRSRDANLNLAVGTSPGRVTFFEMEGSGMSTVRTDLADRYSGVARQAQTKEVDMVTLAHVFDTYAAGQEVGFLKIDVEGHEKAVIESADWKRHRPIVVLVEAIDALDQRPVWSSWEGTLLANGYLFAWFDGINRFYVRQENADLLERFTSPPNIMDGFQLSRHSSLRPRLRTRLRLQLEKALPKSLYAGLMRMAGRNPL